MATVGERIRLIREGLGMGRQEFADKTGIPKGTLIRTEQGQNAPQVSVLIKIADLWPEYAAYLLTDKTDVIQKKAGNIK
ncbi:helix-turn-helix domain-containing protein [Methylovorus menthalis]|uniref:helix-turn-helix domain-containing protein n=1 Tax=Methylovorus menthalis TaxID=1002227 RepID=UPI001E487DB7|nr:helix-turn-helix transcriptional regulator [Methylovorus menthalis]MCB4812429.1 helix-turn-helix domain-containing protein [Methylovorus menthalis]